MANLSLLKLKSVRAQSHETTLILEQLDVAIGMTSLIKCLIHLLNTLFVLLSPMGPFRV